MQQRFGMSDNKARDDVESTTLVEALIGFSVITVVRLER